MADQPTFHRSLRWAFVMNWGQRGVSTVVTFVVARILGPRDFGTVTMAMLYVGFLQLFLEQGISAAIVQREELEPEDLDAAFWMTLTGSVLFSGLSIALAGWWARANGLPALEPVIDALSGLLLIRGFSVVQSAVLERALRFKTLALRTNVAALIGGAAGIALALGGAGIWALVAQQLVSALVAAVLLWSLSGWVPRPHVSLAHARRLLGFSVHVFSGNLGVFVNNRTDDLLIGYFFGPTVVGLYRLADRAVDIVLELTTRAVTMVSLSHFSRLQHEPDKLRATIRSTIHTSAVLAVPPLLGVAACSNELMAAVGPAWTSATLALKLLCGAGTAKALLAFTGPLLQATAKPHLRTALVWSYAALSATLFATVAMVLRTAPPETQLLGMAASSAGLFLLVFLPVNLGIVGHLTGVRMGALLSPLLPSLAAGGAALALVSALRLSGALGHLPALPALAVTASTAVLGGASVLLRYEPAFATRLGSVLQRVRRVGQPSPR